VKMSPRHSPPDFAEEASGTSADPGAGDDRKVDEELLGLLPMIEILDRAGARMGKALALTDPPAPDPVAAGTLGDFRIVRVVGRGGMGVVYEAIQVSLNRRVALKILPAISAEDPRKVRRFQVEVQAAACLQHPHIVPVHFVGTDDGLNYYAMQFIDGRNLGEIIAEGRSSTPGVDPPRGERPSPRMAAELGRQAALALHCAHEQGIIHRDVKPSNLLIDNSGWLWVSDFGLARIVGQADLTLSGTVLGTLRYASPEQAFGARGLVDHRTDVYSLGVTLYELITLEPAFDDENRLELLRGILQEQPIPPARIDPSIPVDLETIVLKAIAKDPADRYPTAQEMADDLARFLQNRAILARRPSVIRRATRWVRRHPSVSAAALLLVAVIGCIGVVSWHMSVPRLHDQDRRSRPESASRTDSKIRRLSYDAQMRLAQNAWKSGSEELVQGILEGLRPASGDHDLRGFEWYYMKQVCHRDFSVLTDEHINELTLTPDGRTLVLADNHGSLIFWDLAANRARVRVQGHNRKISGLLVSPDGEILVSWSDAHSVPSEVKLWDLATGKPLTHIPRIEGFSVLPSFSPAGSVLAIVESGNVANPSNCQLMFWNLVRGPQELAPGPASIECNLAAYSPNGRWLATAMKGGHDVTLRDAATGRPIKTFAKRFPGIEGILFSPDDTTLAAHTRGVTIWDVPSGRELGSLPHFVWRYATFSPDGNQLAGVTEHGKTIELVTDVQTKPREVFLDSTGGTDLQMAFSSDGKTIAGGGTGRAATLWDRSTMRKLAEFPGKSGVADRMVFTPAGESLIFKGEDGRIRSWNFGKKLEPLDHLGGHEQEVWGLAFTPDGHSLISSSDDHSIKTWNMRDGKLETTLTGHDALVTSVAISPDGRVLASGSFDNTVRLWDLPDGRLRAILSGHSDRVRAVAFSPDGRYVASASSDTTVRVWAAETQKSVLVFQGHTDSVRAVTFDPSGALLVSASNDRTIRGIDFQAGREVFALPCPEPVLTLAFSPDRSLIASGDERGNLTTWNVATWSQQGSFKALGAPILGLAFSPDGRTLASGCGDAMVRLWDPITGQVLLVLDGHAKRVNVVAFAPDGASLASASHDGAIRLWRAKQP
jgi:WD40 repeat protein/serine/threonine protein kinase